MPLFHDACCNGKEIEGIVCLRGLCGCGSSSRLQFRRRLWIARFRLHTGLEMPGRCYLSGTKAKENFTGHELDTESGMIYAGARYYMPNIGRWTSVDPLADEFPAYIPNNYVANHPQ